MSRKFSDISLEGKVGLVDLIESKKHRFNSRLGANQVHIGDAFSNGFAFIPMDRLLKLDDATKKIFSLIKENPEAMFDNTIEALWQDVGQKYFNLYSVIENFNESGPGVNEIMTTNEWRNYVEQVQRQLHEFDRGNNNTGNYTKLTDLETRTYTLLSLVKSAILETKGVSISTELPEGFEEAKKIADSLLENKNLIESGIQSSKSIRTFNVNNIDEALRNTGEMFYNKDAYLIFVNQKLTLKDLLSKTKDNILENVFLGLNEFYQSPKWWLILGLIPFSVLLFVLSSEYNIILSGKQDELQKYKDYWQIITSIHLIGASFLGYLTVFCFSNFKKLEQRHEAYRFRGILTRSFGYLIKTADEEQKKILYPKALDAIFKDLPESNSGQDVNINLPVSEIMKGISAKP